MNQSVQVANLTKETTVALDARHIILPGRSIVLDVFEFNSLAKKINAQKQLGWIDWKVLPGSDVQPETPPSEELQPASVVAPLPDSGPSLPNAVPSSGEPHPASPLISKRMAKKLAEKQEGDQNPNETKGTV